MSTGVESFANLDQLGPLYPMVGTEGLLTIIGLALWIVWHIWQLSIEKSEHEKDMVNAQKWKSARVKEAVKDGTIDTV